MDDQAFLEGVLAEAGAVSGTIHRIREGVLHLTAAVRIPPPVVEVITRIPKGKGMAGLAWSRAEPVETCDLKTDETGDVRPGARAVNAAAAVAIPVGAPIHAVVGFAFSADAPPLEGLTRLAETLSTE